jgi:hypothetical protein
MKNMKLMVIGLVAGAFVTSYMIGTGSTFSVTETEKVPSLTITQAGLLALDETCKSVNTIANAVLKPVEKLGKNIYGLGSALKKTKATCEFYGQKVEDWVKDTVCSTTTNNDNNNNNSTSSTSLTLNTDHFVYKYFLNQPYTFSIIRSMAISFGTAYVGKIVVAMVPLLPLWLTKGIIIAATASISQVLTKDNNEKQLDKNVAEAKKDVDSAKAVAEISEAKVAVKHAQQKLNEAKQQNNQESIPQLENVLEDYKQALQKAKNDENVKNAQKKLGIAHRWLALKNGLELGAFMYPWL